MADPGKLQESQNLSMFLATQNKIRDTLKEKLQEIPNFEDLISEVVSLAVHMFENSFFVNPDEKHMLVKVKKVVCFKSLIFLITLINTEFGFLYK